MDGILGEALLALYRLVRGIPPEKFRDEALEAIKPFLPFERAQWGTFIHAGNDWVVHSYHPHGMPYEKHLEWQRLRQYDQVAQRISARPGHTVSVDVLRQKLEIHPDMLAHIRKWGLERTLSTVWRDPHVQIWVAIGVHRGADGAPFSERERKLMQELVPHLIEAWNANAILYTDRSATSEREASLRRALVDREGLIYSIENGFAVLLRTEFPEWQGPRLPEALTASLLARETEAYRGKAIAAARLRETPDGMLLVGVRPVSTVDRLTARERAVARDFAAGRTYKEIASRFGVSPATVRNQLQAAYAKLGVTRKIELAKILKEEQ